MKVKQYESVKLDKEIVDAVRKHVKTTRQSISGFFALAAEELLKTNKHEKSRKNH
jgi:hypothetical protein